MKVRTSARVLRGPLDVAPLVDVILLLLIFFLLTSSFVFQPGIVVDPRGVPVAEGEVVLTSPYGPGGEALRLRLEAQGAFSWRNPVPAGATCPRTPSPARSRACTSSAYRLSLSR